MVHGDSSSSECEYNTDPIYVIYSAMISFYLPLLIILYTYAAITIIIVKRFRNQDFKQGTGLSKV